LADQFVIINQQNTDRHAAPYLCSSGLDHVTFCDVHWMVSLIDGSWRDVERAIGQCWTVRPLGAIDRLIRQCARLRSSAGVFGQSCIHYYRRSEGQFDDGSATDSLAN
jgi:hypothetical protein